MHAMDRQTSFARIALSVFAILLLVPGCSRVVEVDATLDRAPLIAALPATIGVSYNAEFRDHVFRDSLGTINQYEFFPGRSSIPLFDQVFSEMFAESVLVEDGKRSLTGDQSVDAIIAPRITAFTVSDRDASVRITYEITLSSPRGQLLGRWVAHGSGAPDPDMLLVHRNAAQAERAALRDAVAKFIVSFYEDPVVRTCLNRETGQPGAAEPACFPH
jgi:hypothetical protein